jgi:DNA (cytosine-5)-methyltransferase 1
MSLNLIDLFAGAGGLSEGFINAGFNPVAHVEMNKEACETLKTRLAYHYLKSENKLDIYYSYLKQEINKSELLSHIPTKLIESVINEEINDQSINGIFKKIDALIKKKKIDILIGGPSCQSYSLIGRSRDPNNMVGDQRNYLFKYYAQFLDRYKPKFFVFENVIGLLTAGNSKYLNSMITLFEKYGYGVEYKILSSDDYGVLQKRRRVIIIGKRGVRKFSFPDVKSIENKWEVKKDLFYDLPKLKPGEEPKISKYTKPSNEYLTLFDKRNGVDFVTQHVARKHNDQDLEIYKIAIEKWIKKEERLKYSDLPKRLQSHANTESFLDRFKVVDPKGHSHTVVAHISKDGHHYIYPDLNQVRSISVREAARLQSFPDSYHFEGGRTAAYKQIGNAVPPLMAKNIAEALLNYLK